MCLAVVRRKCLSSCHICLIGFRSELSGGGFHLFIPSWSIYWFANLLACFGSLSCWKRCKYYIIETLVIFITLQANSRRFALFGSRINWQYFVPVCTRPSFSWCAWPYSLFVHLPAKVRGSQLLKTALQPKAELRNYLQIIFKYFTMLTNYK